MTTAPGRQVVPYAEDRRESWQAYVASRPEATIAHQIEWRDIIGSTLGHQPRYLLCLTGTEVTGVLPLFLVKTWWGKKSLISIPWIDYGGILAGDSDSAEALLNAARRIAEAEECGYIEFRSVNPLELALTPRSDKVTFLLELDRDPEAVWSKLDSKLRNQIRKSQKSGLATEFAGTEGLNDFYRVFCRNMRDLGTPVWGRDFFAAILDTMKESARLLLVRKDGRTIAGGLALSFRDRWYVPSASSLRGSLQYCPNHALYWAIIEKACRDGRAYFDFGRSSEDSPTYRFKIQWAQPTPLAWQYHLAAGGEPPRVSPQNPKYRLFIGVWRHLPLPLANFLGPKVIKNFP